MGTTTIKIDDSAAEHLQEMVEEHNMPEDYVASLVVYEGLYHVHGRAREKDISTIEALNDDGQELLNYGG